MQEIEILSKSVRFNQRLRPINMNVFEEGHEIHLNFMTVKNVNKWFD